jgi:hypothetical protein
MCVTWSWCTSILAFGFVLKSGCDNVHSDIQIQSAFSCNRTVVRVAIDVHSEMQILSDSAWYCTAPPLQLQPDCGPSCNWYTLWVANTEHFHLILYYPFSCNPTVVRVAIGTHSELQILNPHPFSCGCSSTCPSVATEQCSSCNRCPLRVANTEWFHLIV